MIGEHNEYVCTQLLGISDEEFVGLMAEGVLKAAMATGSLTELVETLATVVHGQPDSK